MHWRITAVLVAMGLGLLFLARLVSPTQDTATFWSAFLVSVAASFVILVPVFLVERRLARQIEKVQTRVDQVSIQYERTIATQVNTAIREQWAAFDAAESEFRDKHTGESARTLLEIGRSYGLLSPYGLHVNLPAKKSLLLRIFFDKNTESGTGELVIAVCRKNATGNNFEDLGAWLWLDDVTLDDLMSNEIYNLLVREDAFADLTHYVSGVAGPMWRSLTLPIQLRMGMVSSPSKLPGRILSVPNSGWALTERGVTSLDTARVIPVRLLRWSWAMSVMMLTEEWFDRRNFSEAINLARRTPRSAPPMEGSWRKYVTSEIFLLMALIGVASGLVAGLVWLVLLVIPVEVEYLSLLPYGLVLCASAVGLYHSKLEVSREGGRASALLLVGVLVGIAAYYGRNWINTQWPPMARLFVPWAVWEYVATAIAGIVLIVSIVIAADWVRSWFARTRSQLLL